MIPQFDAYGNLPPGIYWPTWDEFMERFGISPQRVKMLEGLRRALEALKAAGCAIVYIDGSFVTSKVDPADFDACYEVAGVNASLLNPVLLDCTPGGRTAQKAKYNGELFPDVVERATGFRFSEFFQWDRDGNRKGIIALDLGRLS